MISYPVDNQLRLKKKLTANFNFSKLNIDCRLAQDLALGRRLQLYIEKLNKLLDQENLQTADLTIFINICILIFL